MASIHTLPVQGKKSRRAGKSGPPRYEQPAEVVDIRSLEIEAQSLAVAEEWIVTLRSAMKTVALRLSAAPAAEIVGSDVDVMIFDLVRDAQLTLSAMGDARRMRSGRREKAQLVQAG